MRTQIIIGSAMRLRRALSALVFGVFTLNAFPVLAANDHAHHGAPKASVSAPMTMVAGQVKKLDPSAKSVTLAHGPLTHLGMPAMTMTFKVSDSSWLKKMKVGDTIRFMADKIDGAFTVVHFEPMK